MPADQIPTSLQESILAALIFDDKSGAAIAAQLGPQYFDEAYREIAERVLNYRRKYRRAPGRAHLDDLFGKVLSGQRPSRMRRIIFDLAELSDGINGSYVVERTGEFIREQQYKAALVEGSSRFEQGGENLASDLETIFGRALRSRATTMTAGTFLDDTERSLRFFDRQKTGLSLGIPELDNIGLYLRPREQILLIQPKGTGKSWACVHAGARALQEGRRVVHISLEMPEEEVAMRYYMRIFAVAAWPDRFNRSYLDFDSANRLSGFRTRAIRPSWDLTESDARRKLKRKILPWGARLGNLVIKDFPSGQLTLDQLEGYLDYLEMDEKFAPHLLIVDYPDLMRLDAKNLRVDTGRTFVGLRGIAARRYASLFTPTQGGRATIGGKFTRSTDVTEDISKVFTADYVLTYARTEEEEERGLGRLQVEHARGTTARVTIVLTQSYSTGQYVLQSALMQQAYWDEFSGDEDRDRRDRGRD